MKNESFLKSIAYIFIISVFILLSCKSNNTGKSDISTEPEKSIPSVCIWDNISLREKPLKKTEVTGFLELGEEVIFTGIKEVDSSFHNQVYLQIITKENNKLWAPQMALITEAQAAVIIEEATVYLRPDLLTLSDIKLPVMEIVAISDTQDDWVFFLNEKKLKSGWVKADKISFDKEDISFALFSNRIFNEKSERKLTDRISYILQNNKYPNSQFVKMLVELEQKEKEKQTIEDMMIGNE